MAHFAKLNEQNIVENVIVVDDADAGNLSFPESEAVGLAFLNRIFPNTTWKQTCPDGSFRLRCASIGGRFHPEHGEHGAFSNLKHYDSYIWDESVCDWVAPISYPTDGREYDWYENAQKWVPIPTTPAPQSTFIG
jgi:hypothetical protein